MRVVEWRPSLVSVEEDEEEDGEEEEDLGIDLLLDGRRRKENVFAFSLLYG